MLALTFLVSVVGPIGAVAAEPVTIEFLNPLAKIDMHDSQPLAERPGWQLDPVTGKLTEPIALVMPHNGDQAGMLAVAMGLIDRFGSYGDDTSCAPGAGIILLISAGNGGWGPRLDQMYDLYDNSPDGGAGPNSNTANYYTFTGMSGYSAAAGGPTLEALNLRYSSHPTMNAAGGNAPSGTRYAGDIDAVLAGTAA